MARWRKTRTPGVYVAHQLRCPALDDEDERCRCRPSWRGRRHNPLTGKPKWQRPVVHDRAEALAWLSASRMASEDLIARSATPRSLESIGDEWLAGVEAGRIGRRKGRGRRYSQTTIDDYARSYRNFLRPEFGPMIADDISELEWQMWIDQLGREGPVALAHLRPRRRRISDLRLGDHTEPALCPAKPAPPRGAPSA
jgi:hypothetical protein